MEKTNKIKVKVIGVRPGEILDIRELLYDNTRGENIARSEEKKNTGNSVRNIQPGGRILPTDE